MKTIGLILLLISTNLYSAVPTPESLFRNGNNKDLNGNFIVLKFVFQQDPSDEDVNRLPQDPSVREQSLATKYPPRYAKLIFSLESEGKIQMLQCIYNNNEMNIDDLLGVHFVEDINEVLAKEEQNVEKKLFYSLLLMFSLNESSGMASVLRSHNHNFTANENLLNLDKKNLLEKYKEYLVAIKNDKKMEEELVSPLKPIEPEEKVKINDILNSSMYTIAQDVELVRENRKFYWKVSYENFLALFNHESHRLAKIQLLSNEGSIEGVFGDYILFDGIHELPKVSILKSFDGNKYKLNMLSIREFTNKGKRLDARAKEYLDILKIKKPEAVESTIDKFFY